MTARVTNLYVEMVMRLTVFPTARTRSAPANMVSRALDTTPVKVQHTFSATLKRPKETFFLPNLCQIFITNYNVHINISFSFQIRMSASSLVYVLTYVTTPRAPTSAAATNTSPGLTTHARLMVRADFIL